MIIQYLQDDVVFYTCIVFSIVVSVVLHELAHGVAAIWQGDRTPIELGHMTLNPMVHMGGMSLVAAFVIGMAWGAMPVTPHRFRHGRLGDVLVSLAGPATNALLAVVALAILGILKASEPAPGLETNLRTLLWTLGYLNIVLAIFNLGPVPPLDGSRVLSGVSSRYRRFIDNLEHPENLFFGYFILIMALERTEYGLWAFSLDLAAGFVNYIELLLV